MVCRWVTTANLMSAETVWPNAELVAVQSRLYSPGYVGPARWVLFEPRSRRAFSALGKDVVPEAISILAAASGSASRADLLAGHEHVSSEHLDSLIRSGVLRTQPPEPMGTRTFLSAFHRANVDYGFFDYGSLQVVEEESDLLDHYAKLWPAPPPVAERVGERLALPDVAAGPDSEPPAETGLTPESLAWIMRTALEPIGRIRTRYVNCLRRTTPSGGARHPSEVVAVLGRPVGGVPVGAYAYDVESRSLVAEPAPVTAAYIAALGRQDFGFVVRLRVDRAMWRYRDLRALRPVLIDAGHTAELVSFMLARIRVETEVVSAPVVREGFGWLTEPEVALVRPGQAGAAAPIGSTPAAVRMPRRGEGYLTNPALVLRFGERMSAAVCWPTATDVPIDLTEFLILNHCLPSTRGDRVTTTDGIMEAVPAATAERIERLRMAGALLPYDDAAVLYDGGRLWVRHEWYMALIAYVEALVDGMSRPVASRLRADAAYTNDLAALYRRRTSRVFTGDSLTRAQLDGLLARVFAEGDVPGLDVMLAVWTVEGLEPGIYRWQSGELRRVGEAPERDAVAASTAGQSAASGGSVALWLSTLTDPERPARYLMDLVDLGRLGQRICVAGVELGVATFLTPATYDSGTMMMLGLDEFERRLTYLFGLGVNPRSIALSESGDAE